MRRSLRGLLALGITIGLLPWQPSAAQAVCNGGPSCSIVVTLQLPRPELYSLTLSSVTTQVPALSAADFTAGRRDVTGPTLTIKANAAYRVTVQAALTAWQYNGTGGNPAKPASDLLWGRTASGPFQSSASAATLWPSVGTSAPPTSGQAVALFYRTLWQWTTSPPGNYALPVNLTLTSP